MSDGVQGILAVRKKHRASIPETVGTEAVGAARGRFFDDRITRKDRMFPHRPQPAGRAGGGALTQLPHPISHPLDP